ncbi:MAG: Holliday junction branch migration protein RuvA [Actinomycetes bacterium]
MIAFVSGRVAAVRGDHAVVDVGGVGLTVMCTPPTLASLRTGEAAQLSTALVVREDSLTLFGFADDDERTVFDQLQSVTGVGPRLAQAVLAVHRPDALRGIVARDDLAALTAVPGIGRKGAQRLVLELKDRLGPPSAGVGASPVPDAPWAEQVQAALVSLGWSAGEAARAVDAVAPEAQAMVAADGAVDVGALLRAALRSLGPR